MNSENSSDLAQLISRIRKFNEERDWAQFHNPKDLAITLTLEASELLEHFQWKSADEMSQHIIDQKEAVGEELADVLYNVLLMSHYFDIDILAAAQAKMKKNEAKYPVDKAKGSHSKYTEYQ